VKRTTRFRLAGLIGIGLLLIALFADRPLSKLVLTRGGPAPTAEKQRPAGLDPPDTPERLTQTHVQELARLEEKQRQRQQAVAGMKLAREHLQLLAQDAWSEVLATNSAAFLALRKQAAQSPKGKTRCTLCDGAGYQPYCVLCAGDKGKCPSCKGTGRLSAKEYCPACIGSGKCFLCSGHGKMTCPFCRGGMVSLERPLPPARLPIE
jgi:hypothetical protein